MPELPEVETIKNDLRTQIIGKKITNIKVYKSKVIKEPSLAVFKKRVISQTPCDIIRKGKLLIIKLSSSNYLIIHLRIAGWLEYGQESKKARVSFVFADGSVLSYMDQRLLGELRLRKDYKDLKFIKELGPDPFEIKEKEFTDILKSKKGNIKSLLMNQNVISGLGNIYAQETLFRAKIHPLRKSNSLSGKEIKNIYNSLKKILRQAIKNRGSSVDTYRDVQGEKGGMERLLKVYGKKGSPCCLCGEPIEKISVSGRGTCFCPVCQR